MIKSPLENVLTSAQVSEEIRDDLKIMDQNTNRLLDLVNQLLDFRKTETKGFQLNFVECDVTSLLRKTYTRFTPFARQRGLDFTLDVPDDIYASVDKEGLTKIFSNLFANAVKYAETYIRAKLLCEDTLLEFIVCNDGEVIPPDIREDIFKPFVQYKRGSLQSVSGTGIGLALARSLSELHGGTLRMDQSTDCNCFVLTLPVKHSQTITALEREGSSPLLETALVLDRHNPGADSDHRGKIRYALLVVEDNPEMLAFVVKQLSVDYQVFTAANGVEALAILKERTVNLVISDIVMPEMDGLELCDYLKSELDFSHIPVILLTAKTTLQSKIEGLKSGADAYIEKPFRWNTLKSVYPIC